MRYLAIFCALTTSSLVAAESIPTQITSKYKHLLKLDVNDDSPRVRTLGDAKLYMRDGIRVLYLRGDRFEMAYQHGKLLQEEIGNGALPKIGSMVESAAKNSFPDIPTVVDPIIEGLYKTYTTAIINHSAKMSNMTKDDYMTEAYGLSAGSGLALDIVVRAFLSPETLQIILGQQMRGQKNLPAPYSVNECTDFAIPPAKTLTGGFIIGRNTDYSLNGYFDKYPTIIYYNPTDGAQPYMSITSAGVHTAGVVGYNQSGIFLGVHTIPTWDTSMQGFPVFDVGQKVLREAKSFDDAVTILRAHLPGAGWTYTLVSTRENRSAAIEVTNSKLSIRETTGDHHIQSNHFISKSMLSRNLDINATINEDTRARYNRTQDLLTSLDHPADASAAVRILADKTDPLTNKISGIGNVIATHMTVTSSVIDTAKQSLYLANGMAPTSLTRFVEFPLIERFNPKTFQDETYETITENDYHTDHPAISKAEQIYIKAKDAYEIELNRAKALSLLEIVTQTDPDAVAYQYMTGLMAIKVRDYTKAQNYLRRCQEMATGHYKLACQYYIARTNASTGETDEALQNLQSILTEANPKTEGPLIRATIKSIRKLRRTGILRLNPDTLGIFMPEADVLAY